MRRLVLLLAALLSLHVVLPAAAEVSAHKLQTADLQCKAAQKSLAAGDRAAAREAYERALHAIPEYPEAHVGMGHLAMAAAKFEEALAEYRKALDGFTTLGDAMGQVQMRRYTDVQERKSNLREEQSTLMSPSSRVSEATKQTRLIEIESELRALDALDPPRQGQQPAPPGELHFHVGNALARLGRIPEAVAEWETCAAASPRFAPVHNNLAFAYWKQGRLPEARASLAKAEELGFTVNPQFRKDLEAAGK